MLSREKGVGMRLTSKKHDQKNKLTMIRMRVICDKGSLKDLTSASQWIKMLKLDAAIY